MIDKKMNVILYTLIAVIVIEIALIAIRPLLVAQAYNANEPYTVTYTNSTGGSTSVVLTPSGGISGATMGKLVDIACWVWPLLGLVAIIAEVLYFKKRG